MFSSYEFLSDDKRCTYAETLSAIRGSKIRVYAAKLISLIFYAVLFAILSVALSIAFSFRFNCNHPLFIRCIFKNAFINIIIPLIISIFFGAILSLSHHRIIAYLSIVVWATVSGTPGRYIIELLPESISGKVFNVYEFINIFPLSIKWIPNYSFGYTTQHYHAAHLIFIMLLLLSCLVISIIIKHKNKFCTAILVLLVATQALCLTIYFSPNSKVIMQNTYSTDKDAIFSDLNYYNNCTQLSKSAEFFITKYTAEFLISNYLTAEVEMDLSNDTLSSYEFTLYHGYKVLDVYDNLGNQLEYEQNGDYITVKPTTGKLNKVIFKYKGYSPRYYSNSQGVCLPGFFPYYPRAGLTTVFDTEMQSFIARPSKFKSEYSFKINGLKVPTFSNLQGTYNYFTGLCTDVSIVAGYYDVTEYNGIKVVYPYLDPVNRKVNLIQNSINQIAQNNPNILSNVSTMIIIPSLNQTSETEQYCMLNDHWTIKDIFMLSETIERIIVPENKKILYDMVKLYESDPQNIVELITVLPDDSPEYPTAVLFNKLTDSKETQNILRQCMIFLKDDTDTRSVYEFLESLSR